MGRGGDAAGYGGYGEAEAFRLAEENLSAVYGHIDEEMDRLLLAESGAARTEVYAQMVQGKEGMLFLSDQLLRLHTDNAVREYPDVMSINVCSFVILVLILVFSAILLTMCSRRMIRSICAPIDLLVEEAKKVAGGQYDTPDVTIFNDDEMGYLSQMFNNMKTQVSANFKNMERILELQELLKSTELKALQSQINPHFLFNVLGLAEEAALYENADVTVEIIENISYMLQYSLKCTKQDTTFQEELRMVQAYLFLQERRFGGPDPFPAFRAGGPAPDHDPGDVGAAGGGECHPARAGENGARRRDPGAGPPEGDLHRGHDPGQRLRHGAGVAGGDPAGGGGVHQAGVRWDRTSECVPADGDLLQADRAGGHRQRVGQRGPQ